MNGLTVQDKILIHLSRFRGYRDKIAVPEEITQQGISEAVMISRAHSSMELKRLKKKGLIVEKKAHAGGRAVKKVYFPLPPGNRRVQEIMKDIEGRKVSIKTGEGILEMRGQEALRYITKNTPVPYALAADAILRTDEIDPGSILGPEKKRAYSTPVPRVSRLFGTEEEKARLSRWYEKGTPAYVLIGPVGMGKTSLAASFASSIDAPVFWHSLRRWDTLSGILGALSDFLEKNGSPDLARYLSSGSTDMSRAVEILRETEGKYLAVFDDYQEAPEEIKRAFGMFLEVAKTSGLKMLVTSEPIPEFYGRKDLLVEKSVTEHFLRGISEKAARQLLASSGAHITEEEFKKIYSFSAGHPLTMEMAVITGASEEYILTYLTEMFYTKISAREREMLALLSVYRESVPVEAFVRTERDTDTLRALVKKGMLHYDTSGRYFVHGIISSLFMKKRPLVKEHLRAARYYAKRRDMGGRIEEIYHRIEGRDLEGAENIAVMAVEGAVAQGQAARLLDLEMPDTPAFLMVRGRAMQALDRINEAEQALKRAVDAAEGERKALALRYLANVYESMGDLGRAEQAVLTAMKLSGSGRVMQGIKYILGLVRFKQGRYDEAESLFRECISDEAATGEEIEKAKASLATVLARKGDLSSALEILADSASYFERKEEYRSLGVVYHQMGIYEAYLGRREEAKRHFEMAALYGELTGHIRLSAYAFMNSGDNFINLGDAEKALLYAERAMRAFEITGDERGLAVTRTVIAGARNLKGMECAEHYLEAEKALEKLGMHGHIAEMYMDRARIEKRSKNVLEAYGKAIETYRKAGMEDKAREAEEERNAYLSRNKGMS